MITSASGQHPLDIAGGGAMIKTLSSLLAVLLFALILLVGRESQAIICE
jgi:hypothetical protein